MENMETPPQPTQQKGGFFHSNRPAQPDLSSFANDISNLERRLRSMEERFTNMRRALQVTEQNMLSKNKMFSTEIRTVVSDLHDTKKEIADLKDKMLRLVKEMQTSAKRDEVKVLEKYINLWNPIRFVTHDEIEDIIKEILERMPNKRKKG